MARDDPEDFASKVAKILVDPKKQELFSRESKKLARQFSEQRQVAKQIALYEQLIAKRDEVRSKFQEEEE